MIAAAKREEEEEEQEEEEEEEGEKNQLAAGFICMSFACHLHDICMTFAWRWHGRPTWNRLYNKLDRYGRPYRVFKWTADLISGD